MTNQVRPGEIAITREQFQTAGMVIGEPPVTLFSNEVFARGTILPSVSGSSAIGTLVPGRVKEIFHAVGDRVKGSEPLFSLEGQEIIALQEEYAEVFHQLALLTANYQRHKALSEEQVLARKEFQLTESELKVMQARAGGLRARLKMLYIDPSAVESGIIVPQIMIRSPIAGVITRQDLMLGQYVEPMVTCMEIVDTRKLQLTLSIFEKDLAALAVGQQVEFHVPGQEAQVFKATISRIGSAIDPEEKTISCRATIQQENHATLVSNLYVEAKIITCHREARAVPEDALQRDQERDYIWILVDEKDDQLLFRKIPVQTGVTRGGYTEVLDDDLDKVLIEGAYNLWTGE